jgi:hypothetical protein
MWPSAPLIWWRGEEVLAHAAAAPGRCGAGARKPRLSRRQAESLPHRARRYRLALAQAGLVKQLVFSGGVDSEDGRIEADVMQQHAQAAGFAGPMVLESASTSTRLNLSLSRPLLQAAGVRSVVIVSEPYHLWRIERLVRMSGFDQSFDVQYAGARHLVLARAGACCSRAHCASRRRSSTMPSVASSSESREDSRHLRAGSTSTSRTCAWSAGSRRARSSSTPSTCRR